MKVGASAYNWQTRRPSKWYVDPIDDVEVFCKRHLDSALSGWGMYLRPEEFADTVQELVIAVWKLEGRFDPDKASSFSAYASWIISQRAVDFGPRRVLGRHGTRTHNYMASEDYEGSRMGEDLDRLALDSGDDREATLERILSERSSEISRRHHELGFGPDGCTPLGDTES